MKTENWSPNAVISDMEVIGYPDRSQFFGVLGRHLDWNELKKKMEEEKLKRANVDDSSQEFCSNRD